MTEATKKPEQDEKGRFVSGNIGGGRPKGSRNKLGEAFLSDLQDLWVKEGAAALKEARDEKPMEFVRMVAGILPKELLVRNNPLDEMSEADLDERIDALEQFLHVARSGGGTSKTTH